MKFESLLTHYNMSIHRVTNLNHFLVQLSKTTKFFFCTPVIFIILIMLTITFF